jgi:hypothetical protein
MCSTSSNTHLSSRCRDERVIASPQGRPRDWAIAARASRHVNTKASAKTVERPHQGRQCTQEATADLPEMLVRTDSTRQHIHLSTREPLATRLDSFQFISLCYAHLFLQATTKRVQYTKTRWITCILYPFTLCSTHMILAPIASRALTYEYVSMVIRILEHQKKTDGIELPDRILGY